jgi:preprotein translocase subunit SecD
VQPVQIYVAQSELGPGLTGVQVPDGVVYLQSRPVLTRADLTDAAALTDRQGQHFVGLRLTEAGAQKLTAVSRQNIGNMLAVIVGRELVASPRISQALDRGVLAFTVPTADAATNLAARIRGDAAR